MTARLYRLIEMHQRIDDRLRLSVPQRGGSSLEQTRLFRMKARVKALIARVSLRPRLA